MGKLYERLDERLQAFIAKQQLFFVATAPLKEGHINLSPKGLDSFRVLSPTVVAYQDLVGSGAETIAHLRQNGRITIMFCAFAGPPLILRLHGMGEVVGPNHQDFGELVGMFPDRMGTRSVVRVSVIRIADSCGFGVPTYEFVEERDQLIRWADRKGADRISKYVHENNRVSIDGIPALESAD